MVIYVSIIVILILHVTRACLYLWISYLSTVDSRFLDKKIQQFLN